MNDTTLTTHTTEIVLPGKVESSGLQVRARDLPAPAAGQAVLRMDVDAVFDHVGGPGIVDSWRLLRRGGALVSYGTAATKDAEGDSRLPVLTLIARLVAWNVLPNGRSATFYNFWAGRRRLDAFRDRLRADLTSVLTLLSDGVLRSQVAARFPLSDAGSALALAESRTVAGKVVIVPDA
jgi:NADPH:quinone reductase-like Zn-dependent oxidoreductase